MGESKRKEQQRLLHNDIAGKIVASIVRPPIEAGGSFVDVMILTESVLVGVALACIKLGGDNTVLDVTMKAAKERLAEIRLGNPWVAAISFSVERRNIDVDTKTEIAA